MSPIHHLNEWTDPSFFADLSALEILTEFKLVQHKIKYCYNILAILCGSINVLLEICSSMNHACTEIICEMKSSGKNSHFLRILTQQACADESRACQEQTSCCVFMVHCGESAGPSVCWNNGMHTSSNPDSERRLTAPDHQHQLLQCIYSQLQPIILKIRAGHCNINFTCFPLQKEIGVSNIQNEAWPFNQLLCYKVWKEYVPRHFIIYSHLPVTRPVN